MAEIGFGLSWSEPQTFRLVCPCFPPQQALEANWEPWLLPNLPLQSSPPPLQLQKTALTLPTRPSIAPYTSPQGPSLGVGAKGLPMPMVAPAPCPCSLSQRMVICPHHC